MKTTTVALRLLLLFLMGTGGVSCSTGKPSPPTVGEIPPVGIVTQKGDRQLAIDVNPAADDDYETAFQMAKDTGIERTSLFQNWDTLEPSPQNYFGEWLQIADAYYPAKGIALDLTIAVIHTNQSTVPADLRGKRFDDPKVIRRFKALLDFTFSQMPNTDFASLVIASEHDIFMGTDSPKWDEFAAFYKEIVAYLRLKKPGVIVDIKKIRETRAVTEEGGGWRIGAAVTGAELKENARLKKLVVD